MLLALLRVKTNKQKNDTIYSPKRATGIVLVSKSKGFYSLQVVLHVNNTLGFILRAKLGYPIAHHPKAETSS